MVRVSTILNGSNKHIMKKNDFDDFFESQKNNFSEGWKIELMQRLSRLKNDNVRQYIEILHNDMILEMQNKGKYKLRQKFPNYSTDDIQDILQDAFIRWYNSFDSKKAENIKNPEHHWFLICTATAQITWYHRQNPTIDKIIKFEENGSEILDKDGKILLEELKASFISFPENKIDFDELETHKYENNVTQEIIDLKASEDEDFELIENQNELIELDEKNFSCFISEEVMKYYLLSYSVISYGKKNSLPSIKTKYKPLSKSIGYQIKIEQNSISNESVNAINRIQYLKNSESRKWMEMAISEMRKSKDKLEIFIEKMLKTKLILHLVKNNSLAYHSILNKFSGSKIALGRFIINHLIKSEIIFLDKVKIHKRSYLTLTKNGEDFLKKDFNEIEYRNNTPILSSVVLDKNDNFIATCFKGMVDTCHTNFDGYTKDVTFDNHCEFSLFTDIIKNNNMHLIQDGTLYVTLEPCNKRAFWLDGGIEEPKIPCAVRCVEAKLKRVYIGSIDENIKVKYKGKEILRTGKYVFEIENGKLCGTAKEIKEEGLLEKYFKKKGYDFEEFFNKRVYQIGQPIEVYDFDFDLVEEVRKINSEFLNKHSPNQFRH